MGIIYTWSSVQPGAGGSGVTTYATFADLPTSPADGTLAVTLDTHTVYLWDADSSMWLVVSSPGTIPYVVDLFTLSPTDITNKFVTLSSAPIPANKTILNVIGGPVQDYGTDFTVTGTQLSWSSLFLDGLLVSGDKLIVQYI